MAAKQQWGVGEEDDDDDVLERPQLNMPLELVSRLKIRCTPPSALALKFSTLTMQTPFPSALWTCISQPFDLNPEP